MDPVYFTSDILEEVHQWRRQGVSTMRVSVLRSMFVDHLKEGMVVVNVNRGPHFIYLGMCNEAMVLKVVYLEEERVKATANGSKSFSLLFNENIVDKLLDFSNSNFDT